MKPYLENLLTSCLRSETNAVAQLSFTHRSRPNRDRDVLLGFPDWRMKSLVLDSLWDKPNISVEDQPLTIYSNLCLLLQKRREWRFLTTKLTAFDIPYKWGFPRKLFIDHKGTTVVIMSFQQAKEFAAEFEAVEVKVEVLNPTSRVQ